MSFDLTTINYRKYIMPVAVKEEVILRIQKDVQRTPLFHDLTPNNG